MKLLIVLLFVAIYTNELSAEYQLVGEDMSISLEGEKKESALERNFISPDDGWPDATYWLLTNPVGFVPVPFYFGSSILGKGGGLGLVFLRPQKKDYDKYHPETPDLYALVGFKTSNDDWGLAGGYRVLFKSDKIRWTGVLGRAVMDVEGFLSWGLFKQRYASFGFGLKTDIFSQKLQYEIARSSFYLGLSYSLFANKVDFERDITNEIYEQIPDDNKVGRLAALTPILTYDTRDSIFTPSSGIYANLYYDIYRKILGGDFDFEMLDAVFLGFLPLGESFVSSTYLNFKRITSSRSPFYMQPYVNLRGLPIFYYQGDSVFAAEEEIRWDFYGRFSLVGFGGVGLTASDGYPREEGELLGEYGAGLRYLISKPLKMQGGFDVAWGPSNKPFVYFQFGNSWILRALM